MVNIACKICKGVGLWFTARSRLAIPQLLDEINVLGNPREAAERFGSIVKNPDLLPECMRRAATEVGEGEEPFEQYLARLHRLPSVKEKGLSLFAS